MEPLSFYQISLVIIAKFFSQILKASSSACQPLQIKFTILFYLYLKRPTSFHQFYNFIQKTKICLACDTIFYSLQNQNYQSFCALNKIEQFKFYILYRVKGICPLLLPLVSLSAKGQLISKADQHPIGSPKKQMDEFVLFTFLLFTSNKSNLSVRFLGESTARQSPFWFYLTFMHHDDSKFQYVRQFHMI